MKAADGDPGLDVVAGAVAPPGSGLPAGAKPCPPPARQRQDVQTLMDEHRAALQERGGAVVYLMEAAWWRRWQAPSGASSEPLPPIDNRPLLAADALKTLEGGGKEEDLWLPLREGAVLSNAAETTTSGKGDVVAVPPPAWDALRSWHGGGPPLPRLQLRSAPDADLYPTAPVTPGNAEKLLLDALADEDDDDEGAPPPLALTRVVSAESIARFKSLSLAEVSAGAADCGNNVSMVPDPADPTKLLRQEVRKICFVCKDPSTTRCSQCKAVFYCSRGCQASHWKNGHKNWCAAAIPHADLPTARFQEVVAVGRRGRVGLHNLGNSCYMNSSLQCLSHVFPLTSYFLSNRFAAHLNPESRDGTGGKLANGYYALLCELWFQDKAAVTPMAFKKLMARVNPEYAGLAQQDAHEVVEQFLDKLHEDVNKVTTKPYVVKAEGDGSNDEAVAAEAWEKAGLREDSEVKDVVGSLLREQLVCMTCGKKTTYFEYYQTQQLTIPRPEVPPGKAAAGAAATGLKRAVAVKVLFVPDADTGLDSAALAAMDPDRPLEGEEQQGTATEGEGLPRRPRPRAVLFVVTMLYGDSVSKLQAKVAELIDGVLQRSDATAEEDADFAGAGRLDPRRVLLMRMGGWQRGEARTLDRLVPEAASVGNAFVLNDDGDVVVPVAAYLKPLGAFKMPPTLDRLVVVLQREAWDEESDEDDHGEGRGDARVVGLPRLLWFSSKWSCARIRIQLLRSVAHAVDRRRAASEPPDSLLRPAAPVGPDWAAKAQTQLADLVAATGEGEDGGRANVKAQMAASALLPVRLVNKNGEGRRSPMDAPAPAPPSAAPGPGRGATDAALLAADGGLDAPWARALGDLQPTDNTPFAHWAVGEALNDVPIVSVDWSGAWRDVIDIDAANGYYRHATAVAAGVSSLSCLDVDPPLAGGAGGARAALYARFGRPVTLQQCLATHTSPETMDVADARYCGTCQEHKQARKTIDFWDDRLPEVLILSFKRFKYEGSGGKVETFVDFPIDGLDLAPYCAKARDTPRETGRPALSGAAGGEGGKKEDKDSTDNRARTLYDLFAVCNHFGRMGFGHYTAYARDWMDMYTGGEGDAQAAAAAASNSSSGGGGAAAKDDDGISSAPTAAKKGPVKRAPSTKAAATGGAAAGAGKASSWYKYDDEDVTPVADPEGEIRSPYAYMLFYRRRPANQY